MLREWLKAVGVGLAFVGVAITLAITLAIYARRGDNQSDDWRFQRVSRSTTEGPGASGVDVLRDTATGRCYAVAWGAWGVYSGVLLDPDVPCGEAGP